MARKFDEKQQIVLESTKQNQLVSAGAGSGKTTVMIQKITNLILEGKARPSELIVLTFTNLAANEMKQRLSKSLNDALKNSTDENEQKNIISLISEVDTASVDTIDGFCSKMTKKYFYKLNLSPEINVATGLSLDYYRNKSLDKCIENALETNRNNLINLADCFEKSSRNLDSLKDNLLNAFYFVMAQENYEEFLEKSLKEYTGLNESATFLNEHLVSSISNNIINLRQYINELSKYENYFNSVNSYIDVLKDLSLKNNLFENINQFKHLPDILTNRIKDEDKIYYEKTKLYLSEIKDVIESYSFMTSFNEGTFNNNIQHFQTFIYLLKNFINTYQEMKQKYKVVDFADLERNLLKLLSFEDIRNEIYNDYKYIFVDEYQDINPMQNQIISKLKSENAKIFFVGDVKQSIYGFRQSTPELFLKLYNEYKSNLNSQAFDMNINFRSNPQILEFNNIIFNKLMTKEKTDIDYFNDAQFEPKREDFEKHNDSIEVAVFNDSNADEEFATGLYSVQGDACENNFNSSQECEFIADKILSLVDKEFYDSSIKENRKMNFSDITILSRSVNDNKTNLLIKTLRSHNIPINIVNKISLNESESINLILNILKVIANTADDTDYATFITSNLVNITLDEMFEIANSCKENCFIEKLFYYKSTYNNELSEKINYAFNLLEEIKIESSTINNLSLINMLLNKYHLKQYILNSKSGNNELISLNNFLSTVTPKEANLPLEEFIDIIKTNINNKTEYSQTDATNSVTIQTIHASKGLEYPVVILFNCSKKFKPNNDRDDINFDSDLGIGMQYFNLEKRTKTDSIPRFAITVKNKIKSYKEELRLLYVATTRSQNRLIITGTMKFDNIEKGKIANNSFIELIYSVFENNLNITQTETILPSCKFYLFDNYISNNKSISKNSSSSFSINSKNLDFIYPYSELTNISLKNNVTAISKVQNEEFVFPNKLTLNDNIENDLESSAEIGILYHKYLSLIDFRNEYKEFNCKDIDESLLKLAHIKISPIVNNSIKITNEAPFMMYVPYKEIFNYISSFSYI